MVGLGDHLEGVIDNVGGCELHAGALRERDVAGLGDLVPGFARRGVEVRTGRAVAGLELGKIGLEHRAVAHRRCGAGLGFGHGELGQLVQHPSGDA